MARYIDADKYVCAFVFDEEHEEQRTETMTIEDFLDRFTEEGCPTQFEVSNGELISRQAAIDIAQYLIIQMDEYNQFNQAVNTYCAELAKLPSAQPERKKGKWIKHPKFGVWECDQCGIQFKFNFKYHDFCPNCGADMKVGDSE